VTYFTLSSGGQDCGLCLPWEGILATDGEPDDTTSVTCDEVESAGVFHTGCGHTWEEAGGTTEDGVRTFKDSKDLEEWAEGWNSPDTWTDAQWQAARDYTGSSYSQMNGMLRGTIKRVVGPTENANRAMISMMKPLPNTVRVTRAMKMHHFGSSETQVTKRILKETNSFDAVNKKNILNGLREDMVGVEFQDRGFMSTSMLPSNFNREVILELRVPKGVRATYMEVPGLNAGVKEYELVLDPGRRYVVDAVTQRGNQYVVRAHVVA